MTKDLILSIDTCFLNGSFSVWENDTNLISINGDKITNRSVDILLVINNLFMEIGRSLNEVNKILYTIGPGSYTGLRVGSSTVKGLIRALGCEYFEVSVLEAISPQYIEKNSTIVSVLLPNRLIASQTFYTQSKLIKAESVVFMDKIEFNKFLENSVNLNTTIVVDKELFSILKAHKLKIDIKTIRIASDNLSIGVFEYFKKSSIQQRTQNKLLYGQVFASDNE